jgi:hypothetical protein
VDNRAEVREFLISRRAKITPRQAGLPDISARKVPGLRRSKPSTVILACSSPQAGQHRPGE